jgi:hypothetical protein
MVPKGLEVEMIGGDRSEGVRKFRLGHSLARVFSHF